MFATSISYQTNERPNNKDTTGKDKPSLVSTPNNIPDSNPISPNGNTPITVNANWSLKNIVKQKKAFGVMTLFFLFIGFVAGLAALSLLKMALVYAILVGIVVTAFFIFIGLIVAGYNVNKKSSYDFDKNHKNTTFMASRNFDKNRSTGLDATDAEIDKLFEEAWQEDHEEKIKVNDTASYESIIERYEGKYSFNSIFYDKVWIPMESLTDLGEAYYRLGEQQANNDLKILAFQAWARVLNVSKLQTTSPDSVHDSAKYLAVKNENEFKEFWKPLYSYMENNLLGTQNSYAGSVFNARVAALIGKPEDV